MDSLTPAFQFYRTDPRHVSKSITLKARSLLTLYQQGKRVYSQIGQTGYLKIDLGMRWLSPLFFSAIKKSVPI
ncbi:hypothetical protein L8255_002141 [Salmonella enterica]|nr:hypothetical protein [Salmonella enterica]